MDSWNAGAEALFGFSEDEILGQSGDLLFTPIDRTGEDPEREIPARDGGGPRRERLVARPQGRDAVLRLGRGPGAPERLRGAARVREIIRDLTESQVTHRTLLQNMEELSRFNNAAVGREIRMVELKREIDEMCLRLGELPRYVLADETGEEA